MKPITLITLVIALILLGGCNKNEDMQVLPSSNSTAPSTAPRESSAPAPAQDVEDGVSIVVAGIPPQIQLFGCKENVERTEEESQNDGMQWQWVYTCRSREPFDRTVSAMNASGYVRNMNQQGGRPDYLIANHHYVGEHNGRTWDVDLKASGKTTKLKVTYLVTRAGNW
jgi:hypothetical protein